MFNGITDLGLQLHKRSNIVLKQEVTHTHTIAILRNEKGSTSGHRLHKGHFGLLCCLLKLKEVALQNKSVQGLCVRAAEISIKPVLPNFLEFGEHQLKN